MSRFVDKGKFYNVIGMVGVKTIWHGVNIVWIIEKNLMSAQIPSYLYRRKD